MIYNNLLIFLTAILLFVSDNAPAAPSLSGLNSLSLFLLFLFLFFRISRSTFKNPSTFRARGFFKAEKRLSILALLFFSAILHLCDIKFYLNALSFDRRFPSLVDISGMILFFLLLTIIWKESYPNYRSIFGGKRNKSNLILSNIKTNLPIILPWICISLIADIVVRLPWPWVNEMADSDMGGYIAITGFLLLFLLFFPPLVRMLWECKKLEDGPLKQNLLSFCNSLKFKADIYSWPLFEGRVPTAAVMGIVPGLRYILITPALIETMTTTEMEAIMAHEIGHVKRFHMLLYLLLISGFSLFAYMLFEPIGYFLFSHDLFYTILKKTKMDYQSLTTFLATFSYILFMLFYFRFLFGYFIRNFERQADIYSFTALGSSLPLVSSFEKLAAVSGNSKDHPSWHHFSLGQRIDYLQRCEKDPAWVSHQNKKVYVSLFIFLLTITLGMYWSNRLPVERFEQLHQQKYVEYLVAKKIREEPDNPQWLKLSGNILLSKKMEEQALAAYQQALQIEPSDPVLLNNVAWILLTSENQQLREPAKALTLARTAATIQPEGYILDTLATAFWANNYLEEAIHMETKAIANDPKERRYYKERIKLFQRQSYKDTLRNNNDRSQTNSHQQ